ncbi:probable arabinose 5-phosphate isomerase [Phalaenopsis equestris]|uniref:probable arabinose 5-phosphate isomerase n=1 Tax=Phalaenopsis equestris TaxID=78828 RepID=UPI0009E31938|nr:probable arabinose 5-phosphate isomerase [Phalaenopsis equestris]
MGSLPSITVDRRELALLFEDQRRHLNHFFDNMDIGQAQAFAQLLLDAPGAVFFSGIGKSSFVAQKLSQTLTSLGFNQSAYLHPVDALHGDIGGLFHSDLLVLISKSGSSDELLNLVPCARAKGARIISITSVHGNPLAALCDLNVHLPLEKEVCPFGLAPVTSSAIQMVFGDTILAAIMTARRLTREQYACNHPAGRIGKSLIFKISDQLKDRVPSHITLIFVLKYHATSNVGGIDRGLRHEIHQLDNMNLAGIEP